MAYPTLSPHVYPMSNEALVDGTAATASMLPRMLVFRLQQRSILVHSRAGTAVYGGWYEAGGDLLLGHCVSLSGKPKIEFTRRDLMSLKSMGIFLGSGRLNCILLLKKIVRCRLVFVLN